MSARLEPMTDDDFKAFLRKTIPEYASAQVSSGNWHANEAMRRAQDEFQRILPNGPRTPRQHLFVICDAGTGEKVGMLWFSLDDIHLKKKAFLADFFIFHEQRHKGYEAAALAALDEHVRTLGVQRIELHLFAQDIDERAMFERAGFGLASVYLGKDL